MEARMTQDARTHWEQVYGAKDEQRHSWFEAEPGPSLELIGRCGAGAEGGVIDIGGGQSRLVDRLIEADYADISVLDISANAVAATKARLGERAKRVKWIVADLMHWTPDRHYSVWHDRAVFHFLTAPEDRAAYKNALVAGLAPGGCAVIATFAPAGPERCSGLPVRRYSAETLAAELGPGLRLSESLEHGHATPAGAIQPFVYARFERL